MFVNCIEHVAMSLPGLVTADQGAGSNILPRVGECNMRLMWWAQPGPHRAANKPSRRLKFYNQSCRRPLLGPSPSWKHLLTHLHWRHHEGAFSMIVKLQSSAKVRLKLHQPHTFWPMLASDLILDSSSCSHFLPMWKLFCAVMCWRLTRKCEELLLCVSPDCLGCLCNPRCGDGDVTRPYNTHETAHCPNILPTQTHTHLQERA